MATSHVLAEFKDEAALCAAARALRQAGYARLDAYSPIPVHGIDDALGLRKSPVPLIGLLFGVTGAVSGYVMQWWMNAVDFPINVANRGYHSPPTNIPITFEAGVLIASIAIVVGLIALSGLPRLYHPAFEVEAFRTASVDGLWLAAEIAPGQEQPLLDELKRLGAIQAEFVVEGGR